MDVNERRAEDIDEQFVPRVRTAVSYVELDHEIVVAAPGSGPQLDAHWLDRTAAIVWQTLDGTTALAACIDDLADAFGADRSVVRDDVLELVRVLGRAGLLEGVAYEPPRAPSRARPTGLPLGSEAPPFSATDLDGNPFTDADVRGQSVCVVHWSQACVYCARIAAELRTLAPQLLGRGIALALLDSGRTHDDEEPDEEHAQLFFGVGTPSAYLLDVDGRIASDLAIGANEVPTLLRDLVARDAQ
jgi:hypothetical protein